MSSIIAILDACVLIPAALRDILLRATERKLYQARWTEEILEEMRRNLISDLHLESHKAQRLVDHIRTNLPQSLILEDYQPLILQMRNDPKDRHVLAAAVATGAAYIITFNLRDFSASSLAPYHIQAIAPDAFLCQLFTNAPAKLTQIIQDQAKAQRKPTTTVARVLQNLALHAPKFVRLVAAHMNATP
jgi:predicted nucleic acid-binding protein